MIATDGSITSQGSQISAEGDALLLAKDNINLDVAHNYETQTSDSRASGWGFDNRMTGLPVGMYKSKANGDGTTDTTVSTNLSVGGSATLATTTGDINIIGSNAVSTGDMNLNAANNLNIISAQNTATNENHSRSKAIGNVVISDTERFMGYHSEKANNDNQTVTQVSSNVGSLAGNVNATAGNQYTQIASNVVAGNDINVTAKDIQMLTAQNTGDAHSDQSALKIGVFARVSRAQQRWTTASDAGHGGRRQRLSGRQCCYRHVDLQSDQQRLWLRQYTQGRSGYRRIQ
jgi:filamentous hemagglutinin